MFVYKNRSWMPETYIYRVDAAIYKILYAFNMLKFHVCMTAGGSRKKLTAYHRESELRQNALTTSFKENFWQRSLRHFQITEN